LNQQPAPVRVRRSGGAPPDSAGLRFGAYTQRTRSVFSASKRTILTSERPLASRKVTAYSCGHCARPAGCRALRFAGEPAAEQREHRRLFRLQFRYLPAQLAPCLFFQLKHKLTIHIRIQHFRMHITFTAYRWRIAEPARYFFDSGAEIALCVRGAVEAFSSSLSTIAASTVPAQVRKSFAVTSFRSPEDNRSRRLT
jgi:hypothetical protein